MKWKDMNERTVYLPFVWSTAPTWKEAYKMAWSLFWPNFFYLYLIALGVSALIAWGIMCFLLTAGIATTFTWYHVAILALVIVSYWTKHDKQ